MILKVKPMATTTLKHQTNIYASLTRRIGIARATQNSYLLELLEQEQQQLERQLQPQTLWDWLNEPVYLSVTNEGDRWRGYDVRTKEVRYAATEAEIIDWLESRA